VDKRFRNNVDSPPSRRREELLLGLVFFSDFKRLLLLPWLLNAKEMEFNCVEEKERCG